jgi:hypothetical protein
MRCRKLTGSALALAIFASGSTVAVACDWDYCYGCSGYGYYAAPVSYGYYARPGYAYAPAVYYAPPAYAYYIPTPAYYAPPAYGYSYARPYYGWRGGYVATAADGQRNGPIHNAIPTTRSNYASVASTNHRTTKAPRSNLASNVSFAAAYVATAADGQRNGPMPNAIPTARGTYASVANTSHRTTKAPSPNHGTRSVAAATANRSNLASNVSFAAGYGAHVKYVPTDYYSGPGGYVGRRP